MGTFWERKVDTACCVIMGFVLMGGKPRPIRRNHTSPLVKHNVRWHVPATIATIIYWMERQTQFVVCVISGEIPMGERLPLDKWLLLEHICQAQCFFGLWPTPSRSYPQVATDKLQEVSGTLSPIPNNSHHDAARGWASTDMPSVLG